MGQACASTSDGVCTNAIPAFSLASGDMDYTEQAAWSHFMLFKKVLQK